MKGLSRREKYTILMLKENHYDFFSLIYLHIYFHPILGHNNKKHFSLWKTCARLLSNYIAEFILRVDMCYLVLFCIAQV